MKTILISISQGVAAKNILRTDVITSLLEDLKVRVVSLVRSQERAEYYSREVPHGRLEFSVYSRAPKGLWERFFSALKFNLIRTDSTDLRRRMRLDESGGLVSYGAKTLLNRLIAHRWVRRIVRFWDERLVSDPELGGILENMDPDLIFLPNLFDDGEISLLREARRKGIFTVGYINSWDKLTARSSIRILPNKLIVFNEIVKREAIEYADMDLADILVSGIPQYDRYALERPTANEEFRRELGLPPKGKIIVYAPNGKYSLRADGMMIDFLHEAIQSGRIPNACLLVRFQPNDEVDMAEIAKRPWLRYDIPGIRFSRNRGGDWDMSESDLRRLTDTLAHASVFLCYTSSLSIDAAVFDKPIINIDFELTPIERMSQSPIQYYQMTHYRNATATGGIRIVSSPDELLHWLNRYLENPLIDHDGRTRLVREQVGTLDGRAGRRIAELVRSFL